jgi:hypothetical protein
MVISRDCHGDIMCYDQPTVISLNPIPRFCQTALRNTWFNRELKHMWVHRMGCANGVFHIGVFHMNGGKILTMTGYDYCWFISHSPQLPVLPS